MNATKRFPMQKREVAEFNIASVKLFDVFMEIRVDHTFRTRDHWHNLRKQYNVRKLFMSVRSIEEAEATSAVWQKVFQITDDRTRRGINCLLTAINSEGQFSLDYLNFEWPTIDMGEAEDEAEDERDEPTNRDTDNWSTEVYSLFQTTVWKSSVKHQLIAIHATWHERLEAMRFVEEGQEPIFSAHLWGELHTFATMNPGGDWEDPHSLQNYLFRNKIIVSA
jgi:transcriptional regulator of met regulon